MCVCTSHQQILTCVYLTSAIGRWLSERVSDLRSRHVDTCRSRTIGHIDVGGRMCTRCSPRVHSGFTWEAHRLCSWNELRKLEWGSKKRQLRAIPSFDTSGSGVRWCRCRIWSARGTWSIWRCNCLRPSDGPWLASISWTWRKCRCTRPAPAGRIARVPCTCKLFWGERKLIVMRDVRRLLERWILAGRQAGRGGSGQKGRMWYETWLGPERSWCCIMSPWEAIRLAGLQRAREREKGAGLCADRLPRPLISSRVYDSLGQTEWRDVLILTDAAESFLAEADEHIEAEVAVGRTVKMLEPPQMVAVLFDILPDKTKNGSNAVLIVWLCEEGSYRIESEEDEERDGRHASAFPLFQRDGAVIVVINFRHHLLQDLRGKEREGSKQTDGRTDGWIICSPALVRMRPSRGIQLRPSFDSQCNPFPNAEKT